MPKRKDITNQRFGRLIAIRRIANGYGNRSRWAFVCDCGQDFHCYADRVIAGNTRSCGCFRRDNLTKHGMSGSPENLIWRGMRHRCKSEQVSTRYKARGIIVCKRWDSFANFYADMGKRPSPQHTLERIDNDGNYEPTNVRWATRLEQNHNTSFNVYVTFQGERLCVSEWAARLGMKRGSIARRLRLWPLERALTESRNMNHVHTTAG